MRKIFTFLAAVLLTTTLWAQAPQKMSYQAVVRNSLGQLVTSKTVGMKITILQGSESGAEVYSETKTPSTNANGLVSIEIGGTGFNNINWASGTYFIKTETDPLGGTTYTITGVSQILSVPYAQHAKTAESLTGGITETDPIFVASAANAITSTNITNWTSAFNWGNHAGLYRPLSYVPTWSEISGKPTLFSGVFSDLTSKPTTLLGYGITDAISTSHAANAITSTNISDWTSAYNWGNHATQGYIKTYNETDPIFGASPSNGITATNITNWNTSYGWGNHTGLYVQINQASSISSAMIIDGTVAGADINSAQVQKRITGSAAAGQYIMAIDVNGGVTTGADQNTTYTAGSGLSLSAGNAFSIAAPVSISNGGTGGTATPIAGAVAYGTGSAYNFTAAGTSGKVLTSSGTGAPTWTTPFSGSYSDLTNKPTGNSVGDMQYWNGTAWVVLPRGNSGQVLTVNGSNIPTWQNAFLDPTTIALPASNIQLKSASMNGTVNGNGFRTNVEVEYGLTSSYGTTSTPSQSPVTGNIATSVNFDCNNCFLANTTYHYRIKSSNAVNVTYSSDISFTTLGAAPSVTTSAATSINPNTAKLNGTVNANGYSTSLTFEYGTTTSYGSTVTAIQSPLEGDTDVSISANISGLTIFTTYHYRVKAVNSLGTTYGSDMQFTTAYGIGDTYQGGIIFYVTGTYPNQHGLICAPTDQSSGILWYGNMIMVTIGATGTAVGTGQANTTAIVTFIGAGNYAAKLCDDLVLNGYNDWFLPSKDELALMYTNLKSNSLGGFGVGDYWSSTESIPNGVWYQVFSIGYQATIMPNCFLNVRAVRAF